MISSYKFYYGRFDVWNIPSIWFWDYNFKLNHALFFFYCQTKMRKILTYEVYFLFVEFNRSHSTCCKIGVRLMTNASMLERERVQYKFITSKNSFPRFRRNENQFLISIYTLVSVETVPIVIDRKLKFHWDKWLINGSRFGSLNLYRCLRCSWSIKIWWVFISTDLYIRNLVDSEFITLC